jgi:hypothetical protein
MSQALFPLMMCGSYWRNSVGIAPTGLPNPAKAADGEHSSRTIRREH